MALRERWPVVCRLVNNSFHVSDYFDDLDVHVQGRWFLWTVLKQLAYENAVRRERITMFATDWSRTNVDRFEALEQETEIIGFFTDEERDGVGDEWLADVFVRLKDLKMESKGYRGSGVISPQQFQPLNVNSPVYTPSMVSSGSWSGYHPPMNRVQEGYQWANIHGSPQAQPYRPTDSHFNQFHPTVGVWDVRGSLPSPRFPPDLSQNAFGGPLHNHGSVAARRSRAPPHLRLDAGNPPFDSVQHQTSAPPTPYTAAPLAHGGYSYGVEPSISFGGVGPMYNPQLHVRSVSHGHHVGSNAWPIGTHPIVHAENKLPIFPQSNRSNPVVDTRDPSYIPGDARLLESGPTFHDPHHNDTSRSKSVAKHAFVERGLKDRNPDELKINQMEVSGEGSNGPDSCQVGQQDWNIHNHQNGRESSPHIATASELGNAERAPLFDNTNRAPCDNAGQPGEPSNDSNRGLPRKHWSDSSCSVFVGRLPPDTTKEKLFEIFSRFGPITSIFLRSDSSCFAYVNFREPNARNAAITGMNGFILDGYTITVEPRRYNRELAERTTRKSPKKSDVLSGPQTGKAPNGAGHRVHTVPGMIVGLVSRPRKDDDLMAGRQPEPVYVPSNQQPKSWIQGPAVGYEGPSNFTDACPQHGHPWGPKLVESTTAHGYIVRSSRGVENSHSQTCHGDPTGSSLDQPPVNLPPVLTQGGHDNSVSVGVTPPKSLKKSKKPARNKKHLKGQNTRKEGGGGGGNGGGGSGGGIDNSRSPVHEANPPLSQSDIASESGLARSTGSRAR
ncbi:hypothetical protein GP486_006668, partial [Trichoglossum hirsutum]